MSPEEYKALPVEEREAYQREGNAATRELGEAVSEHGQAIMEAARDAVSTLGSVALQIGMEAAVLKGEGNALLSAAEKSEQLLNDLGIEGAEAQIANELAEANQQNAQQGGGILGPGGKLL